MDRKRTVLLGLLLTLVALVVLDNAELDWLDSAPSVSGQNPGDSRRATEERLAALQRAIVSGDSIDQAYGELAGRYAVRAADLETVMFDDSDPKEAALRLTNAYLRSLRSVDVRRASAVDPPPTEGVVFPVEVALTLETVSHQAALDVLTTFSRPDRGFVWRELDLRADHEQQRIQLKGKVLAMMVRAVE